MATVTGIRGRFFATLLEQALQLYLRHKSTIDAALTTLVIDALGVLVAELPNIISSLNPQGPQ